MKRQFWGAIFTVLGVVALLRVFNIGPDLELHFWPVVVGIAGLGILGASFRRTNWFGLALGLWLTAIGAFSVLANYNLPLTAEQIARGGWPLLLVAIGVSMVFGRTRFSVSWDDREWKRNFKGSSSKLVGETRVGQSGTWILDKDLNMEHGIGDFRLDLTTADITEGTHHIAVQAGIGDVVIRVPDNVTVSARGKVGVGELEVLTERRSGVGCDAYSRVEVPGSPVELVIDAKLGLGEMNIVRRPATKVIS